FFSSRRRHTRSDRDWSSDVCSSDLLDLKHPRGRDILVRLVETADVLTENFRRGTLEKFGLGYDVLSAKNPGLIYCAVSGYGRSRSEERRVGKERRAQRGGWH